MSFLRISYEPERVKRILMTSTEDTYLPCTVPKTSNSKDISLFSADMPLANQPLKQKITTKFLFDEPTKQMLLITSVTNISTRCHKNSTRS